MLFLYYLLILPMSGQYSFIGQQFILVVMIWTDFIVVEFCRDDASMMSYVNYISTKCNFYLKLSIYTIAKELNRCSVCHLM